LEVQIRKWIAPLCGGTREELSQEELSRWRIRMWGVPFCGGTLVRPAALALARSSERRRQLEQRLERVLCLNYRRLFTGRELVKIDKEQREQLGEELRILQQQLDAGCCWNVLRLLELQRSWVESRVSEQAGIVSYQQSLATFLHLTGPDL